MLAVLLIAYPPFSLILLSVLHARQPDLANLVVLVGRLSTKYYQPRQPVEMIYCASMAQSYGRCSSTRVRSGIRVSRQHSSPRRWSRYSGGQCGLYLPMMTTRCHYRLDTLESRRAQAGSANRAVLPGQCVV